ncbi:MAG: hypothetical protein N3D85_00705 [Candidatus Bathyarchaeota archaeon]|nr:hypothetical protein [Candidatus Bathyarchaeota archaeon]
MMVKRVSVGIREFDKLVGGGFPEFSMVVLSGNPGAGKTILSSRFIYEGVNTYGENGVYVCLAESIEKFLSTMKEFGMDFEPSIQRKKVEILDFSLLGDIDVQLALNRILDAITSINAKRVVLDSVTALFMGLKTEAEKRHTLRLIYKLIKRTGCTTIVVVDEPFNSDHSWYGEDFIADGVVSMRTTFEDGVLRRKLRIVKMRGTNHTLRTHSYIITLAGVKILG